MRKRWILLVIGLMLVLTGCSSDPYSEVTDPSTTSVEATTVTTEEVSATTTVPETDPTSTAPTTEETTVTSPTVTTPTEPVTPSTDTVLMTLACFTDMHNQNAMLDYPTKLRNSFIKSVQDLLDRQGPVDVAFIGGDNISNYPYYNRSCALPYRNFLDIKQKIVDLAAEATKTGQVLYVAGNHDYGEGELPTADNDCYNSAEYYETGPMKDTLGTLAPEDAFWGTCSSLNQSTGKYLLAYHYVLNGYDFFGINPHPDDAFYDQECTYDDATIKWLTNRLDQIDPDGDKVIFVLGHLSTMCRKNGALKHSMDDDEIRKIHRAFNGHRNLFYFYGHVHGQDYLAHTHTAESVIHYEKGSLFLPTYMTLTESSSREVFTAGKQSNFTLVHMGGLRPFTTEVKYEYFHSDGLTGYGGNKKASYSEQTGTPRVAQYLVATVYIDRIEFQMRNVGTMDGFTPDDVIAPYTVYFQ